MSLKSDHPVQTIGYWSYNKTLIQMQNSYMNINRLLLSDGNMRLSWIILFACIAREDYC